MIRTFALIGLLLIIVGIASPSFAGPDNKPTSNDSNHWRGVWQDVKKDWKAIGNSIKDIGANAGHAVKNEVREMPENFRSGYKAAKDDFKTFTGSDHTNSKEK